MESGQERGAWKWKNKAGNIALSKIFVVQLAEWRKWYNLLAET